MGAEKLVGELHIWATGVRRPDSGAGRRVGSPLVTALGMLRDEGLGVGRSQLESALGICMEVGQRMLQLRDVAFRNEKRLLTTQ